MPTYRSDTSRTQPDGAILWFAEWLGGPTLAKIVNCQLVNMENMAPRTVTITGEPDTYFSQPAECRIAGCHVRGYVTGDDNGNLVFRQTYF